ncbi:MAG: DNA alkylation repair protein [Acidimicrobiia bacterium]
MSAATASVFAQEALESAADSSKAAPMAAYMKTEMPFYGVQKAGRTKITRELVRRFPPPDRNAYRDTVLSLWTLPHREEKYLAIAYARAFDRYVDSESVPLFRQLIVEGAWWDFVDEIATKLVAVALAKQPRDVTRTMVRWITDDDMWLRRTSIICQLGRKEETDTDLLANACVKNIDDTDFFIRKAIGWSLREYAKTDPEWVRRFVVSHQDEMSGLSIREATKHL